MHRECGNYRPPVRGGVGLKVKKMPLKIRKVVKKRGRGVRNKGVELPLKGSSL